MDHEKENRKGIGPLQSTQKQDSSKGRSWFLGIGIDTYQHFPNLNNAQKDLRDIRDLLLNRYDIDSKHTICLFDADASRDKIIETFDQLAQELASEDKIIIYYSGHGFLNSSTELAYWVPPEAEKGKISQFVPNSTIRDYIRAFRCRHILLISDSCFSGALFIRGVNRGEAVAEDLEKRQSRWGLTSGRHDQEVYDGAPGKNSPFCASILKALKLNERSFMAVGELVYLVIESTRANYHQLPEGNPLFGVGHDGGQYIFRKHDAEDLLWEKAKQGNSIANYQHYLQLYPTGRKANEAQIKIKELEVEGGKVVPNKVELARNTPVKSLGSSAISTGTGAFQDDKTSGDTESTFWGTIKWLQKLPMRTLLLVVLLFLISLLAISYLSDKSTSPISELNLNGETQPKTLSLLENGKDVLQGYDQFAFAPGATEVKLSDNNQAFLKAVVRKLNEDVSINLGVTGLYKESEEQKESLGFFENLGIARAVHIQHLLSERGIPIERIKLDYGLQEDYTGEKTLIFELFRPVLVEGLHFRFTSMVFSDNNFRQGSSDFLPKSTFLSYVDSLKVYFSTNPDASLTIVGHTDNLGNPQDNYELGLQRANNVKKYLEEQGIEVTITARSEGDRQPVAPNSTEEGREKNRRVNLSIN